MYHFLKKLFKKMDGQNYHVLIGSKNYMAGVAKLLVHMVDFCLKNLLAIDCILCKGVEIHFLTICFPF